MYSLLYSVLLYVNNCHNRGFLKLLAVYKIRKATQTPMYIHHSLLPSDKDLHVERAEILRQEFTDSDLSSSLGSSTTADAASKKLGTRTGKAVPNLSIHARVPQPDSIMLKPYDGKSSRTKLYIGEVIHAIRPVVYVGCLYKYGPKTWRPLLVSLLFDLTSEVILYTLDKRDTGKCVEAEMLRRFSVMNYLFKSPVFELVLKPLIEWFCRVFKLPLISGLIINILEYTVSIQHYYFYTEL
jgi:hypothetical protein